MKAVVITAAGGPEVLRILDRPVPAPGETDVLVRVDAAGVNRADLLQRRGAYPAPEGYPADIPGLEYAGVIEAVGAGVKRRAVGDRVMGLIGGGACAEYVVVNENECLLIPRSISFDEAAAIPEAFITAHDALFTLAKLRPGETVLIHAVGSGVGTAGVQLAKAAGATVIGTARTASKLERARSLGMDYGVVVNDGSFADALSKLQGANAVNVVLELAGGDYVRDDIAVLAPKGRLILVGLVAGRSTNVDLGAILRKRLTIRGTALRSRSMSEKIEAARAFEAHAMEMLTDGRLRPVVDRVFEMDDVVAAHSYLENNSNFGKVVLRM